MTGREKIVGVIGGMGPEATIEFMRRIVGAVPAKDDADHIHVIVDNNPKVPSRIKALIEGGGEDPTPVLIGMARKLEAAGADFLTVPCNTAHYYLQQIAKAVRIPVLDIVALTIAQLDALQPKCVRVGMLASPAVRQVGLFANRLAAAGYSVQYPNEDAEAHLLGIIRAVKSDTVEPSQRRTYDAIARQLVEDGADVLLVACTELSLLGQPATQRPVLDTLDVLVEATVRAARS